MSIEARINRDLVVEIFYDRNRLIEIDLADDNNKYNSQEILMVSGLDGWNKFSTSPGKLINISKFFDEYSNSLQKILKIGIQCELKKRKESNKDLVEEIKKLEDVLKELE